MNSTFLSLMPRILIGVELLVALGAVSLSAAHVCEGTSGDREFWAAHYVLTAQVIFHDVRHARGKIRRMKGL